MAEEKKKENKTGQKILKYGFITSSILCTAAILDSAYTQSGGKIYTGRRVLIDDNATVYSSLTDMINEKNGQNTYFDSSYERLIISSFYELNGEYIRVDMKDDYKTKEQQIIEQDGVLIGVITTVDFQNKVPEAYYRIDDIKRKQMKQKKLVK